MKRYERLTIWVGDKCSFSMDVVVDLKEFKNEDLVLILKEALEILEAPTLEDKEIF